MVFTKIKADWMVSSASTLCSPINTSYSEEDKFAYLRHVNEQGVCNIEMEALLFFAFAQRARVRAGVICTVIVNRLLVRTAMGINCREIKLHPHTSS